MLLKVLNGDGRSNTVIVAGQEAVVDRSDVIQAAAAQPAMAANGARSGWFFKNCGAYDMFLNDLADAINDPTKSFQVPPGGVWPPAGYPVSTGALSVIGTAGDAFIAREW